MPRLSPRVQALSLACLIFVLDRATKLWIEAKVGLWDTIPVIPEVFNIVHTKNRGAAFGMLSNASETVRVVVLIGISLVILAVIVGMLWQATRAETPANIFHRSALALVLGGALGNIYDRIFAGSVTDFLQVFLGSYEWPSFNVADSAISVGAVLMAYELIFLKDSKRVTETH